MALASGESEENGIPMVGGPLDGAIWLLDSPLPENQVFAATGPFIHVYRLRITRIRIHGRREMRYVHDGVEGRGSR